MAQQSGTYRWDLLGEINILGQRQITLVKRALKVNVGDCLTEVGILVDQGDESVFDRKMSFGAFLNFLLQVALCFDCEGLSTMIACQR